MLEAQHVFVPPGVGGITDKGRHADVFAKVQVGGMVLRTRPCAPRSPMSLAWNEELVFAVAEPFDEPAVLIIEARVHPGKDEIIGRAVLPRHGGADHVRQGHAPAARQLWRPPIAMPEVGFYFPTGNR